MSANTIPTQITKPKPADVFVGVVATNDFVGKLVRWATSSNVNHAFLVYRSKAWGCWMVAESTKGYGVRVVPYELAKQRVIYAEYFTFPEYDLKVGMRERVKDIGKGYDHLAVVGLAVKLIFKRIFRKVVPSYFYSKKDIFCVELVMRVFNAVRIPDFLAMNPHNIHPGEFRKMLNKSSCAVPAPPPPPA